MSDKTPLQEIELLQAELGRALSQRDEARELCRLVVTNWMPVTAEQRAEWMAKHDWLKDEKQD